MPTSSDSAEVSVVLPAHLHARPAGRLAKAAAAFGGPVEIEYAGKVANAAGILAVLALGATAGETVTLRTRGPDAARAAESLANLLRAAE